MQERIFPLWAYRLPNVEIANYILDSLPALTGYPISSGKKKAVDVLIS